MAIYEFECSKCETEYEALDLFSDTEKLKPCPRCKTMNKKIMSASNFILKSGGCGWHKDNGYNARRSMADGPEPMTGDRHKRSGKTVVPVRGGLTLEPNKDTSKKKKPMIKVQK